MPLYVKDASGKYRPADEDLIMAAYDRVAEMWFRRGETIDNPLKAMDAIKCKLGLHPYEVFGCLYLDTKLRVKGFEKLFRGTIDHITIYPEEVAKASLAQNAAAVIFAHNHPSGIVEPSEADIHITKKLQEAFKTVRIRVLDHFIVGKTVQSLAELGLM